MIWQLCLVAATQEHGSELSKILVAPQHASERCLGMLTVNDKLAGMPGLV